MKQFKMRPLGALQAEVRAEVAALKALEQGQMWASCSLLNLCSFEGSLPSEHAKLAELCAVANAAALAAKSAVGAEYRAYMAERALSARWHVQECLGNPMVANYHWMIEA